MEKPEKGRAVGGGAGAAEAMQLGLAAACSPDELRAVLEYHLEAPLQFDLGGLDSGPASRLKRASAEEGLLLKSLRDLLEHPRPPLDLLRMLKDFAKSCAEYRNPPLPREAGLVLYYAAIAAAQLRWQARLSQLSDQHLAHGIEWALAQPWLDETSRRLLAQMLRHLDKEPRR